MDALKIICDSYCNDLPMPVEKLDLDSKLQDAIARLCAATSTNGARSEEADEADCAVNVAIGAYERYTFEQGVLTGLRLIGEAFRDADPSAKGGTHS